MSATEARIVPVWSESRHVDARGQRAFEFRHRAFTASTTAITWCRLSLNVEDDRGSSVRPSGEFRVLGALDNRRDIREPIALPFL